MLVFGSTGKLGRQLVLQVNTLEIHCCSIAPHMLIFRQRPAIIQSRGGQAVLLRMTTFLSGCQWVRSSYFYGSEESTWHILSDSDPMQLLEKGRTVVAAARDTSKAREVFQELGLSEGINKGFGTVRSGPSTLSTTTCMSLLRLPRTDMHYSGHRATSMHTLMQPRSGMAQSMPDASLRISSHPTRHARELQSFMGPLLITFHSGLASQIILNAADRAADWVAYEIRPVPSRTQASSTCCQSKHITMLLVSEAGDGAGHSGHRGWH